MAQLLKNWTRKTETIRTQSCSRRPRRNFSTENHDGFFNRRKLHDCLESKFAGVKVRWSQGRQFLKLNTDGTFNFTEKRYTSSIWRTENLEREENSLSSEKCLFAPRSRPISLFEKQIGWKILGDFWRKNESSIYQTWRNRTNTYIGLSGARSFCTKRTRINRKSKCQITKSP